MTEEEYKAKLNDLENELESKQQEIYGYLDKIEQLEDTIMKLESCIPEGNSDVSKNKWGKARYSLLEIQLKEKDQEIRDLKNKMGFLRKEKIQLQLHLEEILINQKSTNVIRIEEKKEPLEKLVKDLQDKINKQQMIINKFEKESNTREVAILKGRITDLEKKLESQARSKTLNQNQDHMFNDKALSLTEELQRKLNKAKMEINTLKQKLEDSQNANQSQEKAPQNNIIRELRDKIERIHNKDQNNEEFYSIFNQINQLSTNDPNLDLKIKKLKSSIEKLKDKFFLRD
jgi:chromosome segregation ATPase